MIIGDHCLDYWPIVICLSNDLYEYRKHRRILSPMVTVDLHEGKMMAGPMKHNIINADALSSEGILTLPDSQYRYLTYNIDSSRYSISPLKMEFGPYLAFELWYTTRRVETVKLRACYNRRINELVFGDFRKIIFDSTGEWLNSTVHDIVMKGHYTDKQPKIHNDEEEVDLV